MKLYLTIQFGSYGHLSLSGGWAWLAIGCLAIFMLYVVYILLTIFK